jgi:enamine deaminase RidA (YjgF/YER057c/UK114 family)
MKRTRNPASVHPPVAAYSHQIELQGEQRVLLFSGQLGMTPDGVVSEDPAQQLAVAVAVDNVIRNLEAAQMDVGDLVKLTFYLTEPIDPERRRVVLEQRLREAAPCMTLLYVAGLAAPRFKVEIDAWASSGDGDGS